MTEEQTKAVVTAKTNGQGAYEFTDVKIGQYLVTAQASGFDLSTTQLFTVTVNARQRVDVALKVGSNNETLPRLILASQESFPLPRPRFHYLLLLLATPALIHAQSTTAAPASPSPLAFNRCATDPTPTPDTSPSSSSSKPSKALRRG